MAGGPQMSREKSAFRRAVGIWRAGKPDGAPGTEPRIDIAAVAQALARAVDVNDPPTRKHSQTVAALCGAIASQLGLGSDHVAELRLAGLLHDVGTIQIPA